MPNPTWSPSTLVPWGAVIVDANDNVHQATTVDTNGKPTSGTTGPSLPSFATVVGGTTRDNTVTWTCVVSIVLPSVPSVLQGLPDPSFISDQDGLDPTAILNTIISQFEAETGRILLPAQIEQLLLNILAYRDVLVREIIQYAGKQCLLAFADYPMIDYLAQLVGVTRLSPSGAKVQMQYTITAQTVPFLIVGRRDTNGNTRSTPGYLSGTSDNLLAFENDSDLTIPIGQTTIAGSATCTTLGIAGNGYAVGKIQNNRVTNDPNVIAVTNTTVSQDGADIESTDQLRVRTQLAPNRFTVAGPGPAYRFFALSVDPSIVDVQVTSPLPGQVLVNVLTGPITDQPLSHDDAAAQGIASLALRQTVYQHLADDAVRPLTDIVLDTGEDPPTPTSPGHPAVFAVTQKDYQVEVKVTLLPSADPITARSSLTTAAKAYALQIASRLQQDIVPEEWVVALGDVGSVYRVELGPISTPDLTFDANPVYKRLEISEWANCTSITIHMFSYGYYDADHVLQNNVEILPPITLP